MGMKSKIAIGSLLALHVRRTQTHRNSMPRSEEKFKNALVLSSGGLMGVAWHLATLKRLTDEGNLDISEFDLRVGTSAGGIAVLALGADKNLSELLKELTSSSESDALYTIHPQPLLGKLNWKILLSNFSGVKLPHFVLLISNFLHEGRSSLHNVEQKIDNLLAHSWPTSETWVVTSSSNTNERVVLHSKSGVTPGFAASATAAVPALFLPRSHKGKNLVDGGVISSTHLDLAIKSAWTRVTVLTTSQGFVNPFKARNWLKFINLLNENFEEIQLKKIILEAKIRKIELSIHRPRKEEQDIFNSSSLMDSSLVNFLVTATLKKA